MPLAGAREGGGGPKGERPPDLTGSEGRWTTEALPALGHELCRRLHLTPLATTCGSRAVLPGAASASLKVMTSPVLRSAVTA